MLPCYWYQDRPTYIAELSRRSRPDTPAGASMGPNTCLNIRTRCSDTWADERADHRSVKHPTRLRMALVYSKLLEFSLGPHRGSFCVPTRGSSVVSTTLAFDKNVSHIPMPSELYLARFNPYISFRTLRTSLASAKAAIPENRWHPASYRPSLSALPSAQCCLGHQPAPVLL